MAVEERILRFLADAGAVLTESLALEATLTRATQLTVPLLADICVVYSSNEQNVVEPLSVAHVHPERVEHVLEMIRRFPPDLHGSHPVAVALREERSIFLPKLPIPPVALIRSPEHFEAVHQVGFANSAMIVPLWARGRKYGVLSLSRIADSLPYEADDLWLAEEFARRIAMALDNARLYQMAQASEERYRIISELVSEYAYAFRIDEEQRVHPEWTTDAFARIMGFGSVETPLTGKLILAATPAEDHPFLLQHYEELLTGQPSTLQFRVRTAAGEVRWIENTARPIYDPVQRRVVRIYGVSRDITTERTTQAILQQERELLAQRVAEQTADLAWALRSRDEFLSRMSHELRTPLHAILGFAQLMDIEERDNGGNRRVKRILDAGRHLLDLINEVLDITRIDAGRIELSLQAVHVRTCLSEALASVQAQAEARGIRIQRQDQEYDVWVLADPARLIQVLTNLLSNAVKFNYDQGQVTVTYETRMDDRLVLSITDTGQGIAPELQSRLFLPFERLGAQRRGVEGTGLGLALSRRLVEVMGGTIGVRSVPGEGSTFWIELPCTSVPVAGV